MPELRRILFVEDEADIRAVAKIALEKMGKFDVKICASGQEALDSAIEFAPDLFLLDVMMPGMDGKETLTSLRKLSGMAEIPAMFFTASVQPKELKELNSMGIVAVIAKPFDPMKLAEQLHSHWDEYHQA